MVKNRAAKRDTRKRMDATGEVYSVAKKSAVKKLKVYRYDTSMHDPDVDSEFTGTWSLEQKYQRVPLRRQLFYRVFDNLPDLAEIEKQEAEALMPYNYGWYPRAGFFRYKGWEQVSLTATNDGVMAREGQIAPWAAVMLGCGYHLYPHEPRFMVEQMHRYIVPMYLLITSYWDGDAAPLADFGYAMAKSQYRTYFYHVEHQMKGVRAWLDSNGFDIPEKFVEPRNSKGVLDEKLYSLEPFESLKPLWISMSKDERLALLAEMTKLIKKPLKVAEPKNIVYGKYSDFPSVKDVKLKVGDRIKVARIGTLLEVRAVSERFVVLTFKNKKGEDRYSVINWREGAIGAHDSYGYNMITDDNIAKAIEALNSNVIRISYRNRIPLRIEKIVRS